MARRLSVKPADAGADSDLEGVLARLRSVYPELRRHHRVRSLSVFGSFARGEHNRRSDLDILIDFDAAPTLFEFVRIERELSQLLGRKVDLVMRSALRPDIGRRIEAECLAV